MYRQIRSRYQRSMLLSYVLPLVVAIGFFMLLFLIGGGLILAVLLAVGALIVVGGLHYLFWGRSLNRDSKRAPSPLHPSQLGYPITPETPRRESDIRETPPLK